LLQEHKIWDLFRELKTHLADIPTCIGIWTRGEKVRHRKSPWEFPPKIGG